MNENEAIVRNFIDEAFNAGRLEAIDALLSPDFVEHQALGPGAPTGRDAPRAIVTSLRRAFPDLHLAVEDATSSGDTVWLRLRGTGTHEGPFMGRAPTGKRMAITVFDVMRLRDGKIVEHWGVADRLAALGQLDA